MISEEIKSRKEKYDNLIFPWGNPFDILFLQIDFSEWNEEELRKGYKILY